VGSCGVAVGSLAAEIVKVADAERSPESVPSPLTALPNAASVTLENGLAAVHRKVKVTTPLAAALRPRCVTSLRPAGPFNNCVWRDSLPPSDNVPPDVEIFSPPDCCDPVAKTSSVYSLVDLGATSVGQDSLTIGAVPAK